MPLPAGSIITCPRKGHTIGVTQVYIANGPLKLSSIVFMIGQERIQGEQYQCKECKSIYHRDGSTHTAEGWLPSDPKMEPVRRKPTKKVPRPVPDPNRAEGVQEAALKAHRAKKGKKPK